MDSAEAASSSQKQGQVENTDAAKLDRALDQLAHEQANVQALETKMREMEKQHEEDLEKNEREHALKAEETVLAERAKRVKQLDEERVRFGALKTVLSSRRKALEEAKIAHEIVAGVSKLSEKIDMLNELVPKRISSVSVHPSLSSSASSLSPTPSSSESSHSRGLSGNTSTSSGHPSASRSPGEANLGNKSMLSL